jgi:hypothetical protein|tara:strand:- start:11853 stop:12158 length:306 start_codon:yes stop_codon:yes gene_type:complete
MKDKKMILKERMTDQGLLVSLCDGEVIGKTFKEGKISLTVTESFYLGEEAEEETIKESLKNASIANIMGKESVRVAIETGIISEDHVLKVGEVRHAQFVRL